MSKLEDMDIMIRVVEAGSFTRAAEQLNSTKSMISRRLSDLEKRLGTSLFHRTTRRLTLTDAGKVFYEHSRKIIDDVERVEESMGVAASEPRGNLRIAAPLSFVDEISPAVFEFMQRYPLLYVDLDLNDRHVDIVTEGFDLAIRLGPLKDSSLIAKRLSPCHMVVCASPDYLRQFGEPASPEDISRHQCIVFSNVPVHDLWQFKVNGHTYVPEVRTRIRINVGKAILRAARAGFGLTVLPTFLAYPSVEAGTLLQVLKKWRMSERSIYAVFPGGRYLPSRVRLFVDFLSERFGNNSRPYWDKPFVIPKL